MPSIVVIKKYAPVPTYLSDLDVNLVSGRYNGIQYVTLISDEPEATIYYTTNGEEPTTESTEYTEPISVLKNTTLKAKAIMIDMIDSNVLSADYNIYYTLTYTAGENGTITGNLSQEVEYEESGTEITGVPDSGYQFVNWSDSVISNPRTDTNITENISVTANFLINPYTVLFKDHDETILKTQIVNHGGNATPPANPTRTGYTFSGWNPVYTNITADTNITAQYTINTYTVTFNKNGGDTEANPQTKSVNYNNTIGTLPTPPTKTGYTFSSWNTLANGEGTTVTAGTTVTTNITVYAQWTINTYAVLFKDHDETILKTQDVNYGNDATPPANPTRTGYTFSGWNPVYTNITADTNITAQYTINTYTVTFNKNGGDTEASPQTKDVNYNSPIGTLPTPPTKTGYIFSGWNTLANGEGTTVTEETTVTDDITAYAQWTEYIAGCSAITTGNWSLATNWEGTDCNGSEGKPGTGDDITIKEGVTITMNEVAPSLGTIIIESTGVLDTSASNYALTGTDINIQGTLIANSSTITLSGTTGTTFVNSGTFTSGTSTVVLSGNGDTTVNSGNEPTFYNLTVSGTGTKSLGTPITINNNLTVSAGTLNDDGYQITGNATGTLSLAANTNLNLGAANYTKKIDLTILNGYYPFGSLTLGTDGNYYGATGSGGINNVGVIFQYEPNTNTYTKKITLNSTNGSNLRGSLTLGTDGKFYGMTYTGGANNRGVIFQYDPSTNTYTKKIDFTGTTGSNLGSNPYLGHLTLGSDGNFYGMTYSGGTNNVGVIFQYEPSTNTYTKKIDLTIPNGYYPFGSLTLGTDGNFYGMTNSGGANSVGVIFQYDPSTNTYTKKIDLTNANGRYPKGSLTLGTDGNFYGMTDAGGANSVGVIFQYEPSTNTYTKKITLSSANGSNPKGSLTLGTDGNFYGMTYAGGANDVGVIFQYDPSTNTYTKKIDFTGTIGSYPGSNPYGALTLGTDGKFYGMTHSGGANGYGVIFTYGPNSTTFPTNFTNAHISLDSTSTVNYQTPANQTISSVPTYGNLTLSAGGTKTLDGDTTVTNVLTIGDNTTLDASSKTITLSGVGTTFVNSGTINAGTSTIKFTDTSNGAITFSGGNGTYNNIWFSRGTSTGNITIAESNTFNDLKDDGSEAHSLLFTAGSTQHVATFNVNGSAGKLITINSTTTGTHNLVKDGGGTITCNYLNIQHSVATPPSTWSALYSVNNQEVATAGSGWEVVGEIPIAGKIWFLEHLAYIDTNADTSAGSYTLMRDLDFNSDSSYYDAFANKTTWTTGNGWDPIGFLETPFTGDFNGNGYAISNLYINRTTANHQGLFGYTDTTTIINNIKLENISVSGRTNVGGLVGYNYFGTISNSYSTGTVSGTNLVGGLVGRNNSGTITNSYSLGDVIRSSGTLTNFGGFLGYNSGTVTNCYSTGRVIYEGATNCGFSSSSISGNNYWDMNTSLQSSSGGGAVGKTTAQMKTQSTFTGWDFTDIWAIDSVGGISYPYLQDNEQIPHPGYSESLPKLIVTVDSLSTDDTTPTLTGTINNSEATLSLKVGGYTYTPINAGSTWSVNVTNFLGGNIYDVNVCATVGSNTVCDSTTNELEIVFCFAGDTDVFLFDGTSKKIKNIKPGDLVLSYDFFEGKQVIGKVQKLQEHLDNNYGYYLINNKLKITDSHPLLVNGVWASSNEIKIGDILTNNLGENVLVNSINYQYTNDVYNILLEDFDSFYAENYLVSTGVFTGGLIAGNKVMLKNGYEDNIENIKVGDVVASYNLETNSYEYSKVINIKSKQLNNYYLINNTGVRTDESFYIKDKGWVFAKDLELGDIVLGYNNTLNEIFAKEKVYEENTFYILTVEKNHNFIINNLLVHNGPGMPKPA